MIAVAGEEMTCVALRFFIRTGPLASRLALLFIEIIYAPFSSAQFPVWWHWAWAWGMSEWKAASKNRT